MARAHQMDWIWTDFPALEYFGTSGCVHSEPKVEEDCAMQAQLAAEE